MKLPPAKTYRSRRENVIAKLDARTIRITATSWKSATAVRSTFAATTPVAMAGRLNGRKPSI